MKNPAILSRMIPVLMFVVMVVGLAGCDSPDAPRVVSLAGPRVWLDQPVDGGPLPIGSFTLKAHARDTRGGVARINFLVNDTMLGTIPTDSSLDLAYAEFAWNASVPGIYTIAAVAANSNGEESRSAPARVCVGSSCPEPATAPITLTRTVTPLLPPVCNGAPVIASFTAAPAFVVAGGSTTLSWSVTNTDDVELAEVGDVATTGTRGVAPTATTMYTLVASCGGKENFVEKSVTVTVTDTKTCSGLPVVSAFTATPTTITSGASSTLRWTVTNADRVEIATLGGVAANGSRVVSPRATTTYRLDAFCGGKDNLTSQSTTISVVVPSPTLTRTPTRTSTPIPPPPPPQGCTGLPNIASFSVSPTTITAGGSATLSWGAVTNADSVTIQPSIGGVATPGSTAVSPGSTTTYTLVARCGNSSSTRQVTLTVVQPPPPATATRTSTSVPLQPPAAPSGLSLKNRACSTPDQVQMTWSDNANNETGFAIYRRVRTGSTWGAWTLRTNVGANTTQFTDTSGFTAANRLEYYVKATNAAGASAQSNTLSVAECPF